MRASAAGSVVRAIAIAVVAAAAPGRARADDAVEVDAPPPDDAGEHAALQAAIGAGSDGGAISMTELRAEWSGSGLALGLGGRVRWRGGVLVRSDWDDLGDWLGVIRRLELAHRGRDLAGAVGLGRLAPVGAGAVVDGYTMAALVDHRAPGAVGRLRGERLAVDASVDDVTAPTLVAAGVEAGLGGRWWGALHAAIDPGTDRMDRTATGAIELGARWVAGPVALGGGVLAGRRGDLAAVARGEVGGRHGRIRAGATLELRAFDGTTVAAPYGPLWPVERERMTPDAGDSGVATAITARLAVDGLGVLDAGVRTRGARGDVVTARVALPWWRMIQAGGYAAIGVRDAIVAGEARVVWSARWFSAVEAGRGYRRDDAGALGPVWQLAAWFGATAGW